MSLGKKKDIGTIGLVSILRQVFPDLVAGSPVRLAYLYGSAAEGKTTPLSDVDIALLLDPDQSRSIDPYDCLMLEMDIALALESCCKILNADVRVINDAPLMFQGRMVQQGHLLYANDEALRIGYETLTLKQYLDYLPVANQFQVAYFEHRRAELFAVRQARGKHD